MGRQPHLLKTILPFSLPLVKWHYSLLIISVLIYFINTFMHAFIKIPPAIPMQCYRTAGPLHPLEDLLSNLKWNLRLLKTNNWKLKDLESFEFIIYYFEWSSNYCSNKNIYYSVYNILLKKTFLHFQYIICKYT